MASHQQKETEYNQEMASRQRKATEYKQEMASHQRKATENIQEMASHQRKASEYKQEMASHQRKATEYNQEMASVPFSKDSHWVKKNLKKYIIFPSLMNILAFTACQFTRSTNSAANDTFNESCTHNPILKAIAYKHHNNICHYLYKDLCNSIGVLD